MTSEHKDGVVTYVGVAHPWMRDAIEHMNVRHYMAMFDDDSSQLTGKLAVEEEKSLGWPDVRRADIPRHAEALILD